MWRAPIVTWEPVLKEEIMTEWRKRSMRLDMRTRMEWRTRMEEEDKVGEEDERHRQEQQEEV